MATQPFPRTLYVHSDIPPGVTLEAWRTRNRVATYTKRAQLAGLVVGIVLSGLGTYGSLREINRR